MNDALTKRFQDTHEVDDEVVVLDDSAALPGPYCSESLYSDKTSRRLKAIRKDTTIDAEPVRLYLKRMLKDMVGSVSVDECLRLINKHQQSLVFVNPLVDDTKSACSKADSIKLSLPPGIENLGATCYLNTQLQCLAQNRVFVEGLLSWRPTDSNNDLMTNVIRLFQQLLARIDAGPSAVLNTIEFSNALNLDHYEQQDPNEFSRLLFDRLHDSFQQSKQHDSDGAHDLSTLLPHLFQGMIAYETTCLACKATSLRKEEFMDLNLPIVDPPADTPRKTGQMSILESLSTPKKWDADVQNCLDSYCSPETLEGDNQYWCSECDCKQDALRTIAFEKLPPVLNVQLSRYVFDRATLMKKKLENRILLPLELRVSAKGKIRNAGLVEHRYVLTAVMRHQGKSAYNGHYVAEAMDWLTGQWFEFNDEKVSSLDNGPSCSFDPATNRAKTPPAGSKDAYNMYYVEESFLAQSALESLRSGQLTSPSSAKDQLPTTRELMSVERSTEYSEMAQ